MTYGESEEFRREEMRAVAEDVAVRAKALRRCSGCGFATHPTVNDRVGAYKLANWLVTNKDPLVEVFEGDRRLLTDTIKEVIEETGPNCDCWHLRGR